MMNLGLAAVPNQTLSVQLDGHAYDLTLHEATGCVAVTVVRDGVTLLSGARLIAGAPLLPYRYQEAGGNFVLTTLDGALPDTAQFGVTQFLGYLDAAELAELRA